MTHIGRYDILEEIGRGGFATVYKARDSQLKRLVALKVLHEGWSNDPEFVRRFRQEAETVANLRHPNIVVVHDVGEIDRQLFIAMEFLPGEDLRSWLTRREDPLTVAQTVAILEPVAGALDYAHEQAVVHRDIKPGNMMIHEKGQSRRMVLTDFGMVKAMESSVALTRAGQMLGSPEYMAPEQADPNRQDEIGAHSDNYSFGIVAYQMLAGRVPFPGNSISTLNAHVNLPVPSPQEFNEALPEGVTAVLLKMLAKDPADRYPSAAAFVDALRKTTLTDDQEEVEQLYGQLQEARTQGDWVEVVSLAALIETMQPGYRDVRQWQAEARRQLTHPKPAPSLEEEPKTKIQEPEAAGQRPSTTTPSQPAKTTAEMPGKGEARSRREIKPVHVLGIAGGLVMTGLVIGLLALIASSGSGQDEGPDGTATALALEESRQATATRSALATAAILATAQETTATGEVEEPALIPTLKSTNTPTSTPARPISTPTPDGDNPPSTASLGNTWSRPADEMVMVYVPAGTFMMGSDQGSDNERPVHEVSLDAFWIDQTEVTNALYNRCVADGECDESELVNYGDYNRDDQPVVGVNWFDAEAYCEWAGGQLPTEAQWEYAARGEEGSVYPWGDEFDGQLLNFCDTNCTYDWQDTNYDDGFELTAPVGNYSNGASWVGAYDMAGNVWEYVADRYDSGYYWDSPSHNPTGPASGNSRVLRGGCWVSRSQDARSSVRINLSPAGWGDAFGFRCAAPGP